MLNEMKDGHQTTMVPRPDKITYNTAIKAMSDGTRRGAERAEELLGALEKLASTDEAFRPDTCTYTAIISCYGRSDVENKPQRALELVTRMVQSYEGSKLPKDCISSFNAALNACAFAKGDERARSNAFHTLIFISKLLKVHTRPDHVTYGTILRGCSSLLPYGEQRYKVVEAIFRQACEDGMVGKFTLTQLWFAASPELYQLLTGVEKDERAKLRDMPHVWTRSVREKRDL